MNIRQIIIFPVLLTLAFPINTEDLVVSGFKNRDLDKLINDSPPPESQAKGVFKTPSEKINFQAKILTLPKPRISECLVKAMQINGVKKIPDEKRDENFIAERSGSICLFK